MNNRIQNNPGLQYVATRSLNDKALTTGASPTASNPASGDTDRLSLSAGADRLNHALQLAQSAPAVNHSRVDALRQAIGNGEYQVNAEQLAANMLGVEAALRQPDS